MIEIKNKFLKERIYNILRKNDEEPLNENELKKIKQIKLDSKTFLDEEIQYSLDDFLYLSEIQKLVLDQFDVDDKLIKIINSFKQLKNIEFSHCTFSNINGINNKIEALTIAYCKLINFEIINEKDTVTDFAIYGFEEEIIDLNKILQYKNIQNLSIFNVNIKNSNKFKDFTNLKMLNIDGSNIDCDNLSDLLRNDIKVSHENQFFLASE